MTTLTFTQRIPHGWRSARNWGNYHPHSWQWGWWENSMSTADRFRESWFVFALGSFRVMWEKLEKL